MQLKRIKDELISNHCKITPQRQEILKVLIRAKTPLTAREIFDRIRKKKPNISFDTIYRNLAVLKRLHVINQLDFQDGRARYELNRREHQHHLICLKCGETKKISGCPLENSSFAMPGDFEVVSHRFEIFGYCKSCRYQAKEGGNDD